MSETETCSACGAPLGPHERRTVPFACGLSNVLLEDIRVQPCTKCTSYELNIPHVVPLQRAIAETVAMHPGALNGEKIRFLRKFLGYTHTELAELLGVTRSTVSRWEADRMFPSPAADQALRALIGPGPARPRPLTFRFTADGWIRP